MINSIYVPLRRNFTELRRSVTLRLRSSVKFLRRGTYMELIILYLPLFILIHSFCSLSINPGYPVVEYAKCDREMTPF